MAPTAHQLSSFFTMNTIISRIDDTFGDKNEMELPIETFKKPPSPGTDLSYIENITKEAETKEQDSPSKDMTEGVISKTITKDDEHFLKDIAAYIPKEAGKISLRESIPSPEYVITKRRIYINCLKEDINDLKNNFDNEGKLAVYVGSLKETIKKTMLDLLPLKDEVFLLIVSLIQDSLLAQGWRQYSKSTLDVLLKILTSCNNLVEITMADYEKALKRLHSNKIDTFPLEPSHDPK